MAGLGPVLVCFSGLPGVGKTSISSVLSRDMKALFLRLDRIELAMSQSHMKTEDLADGGYAAAQAVAGAALEQGFDVVADCVNPIALTRSQWHKVSRQAGVRHLDVVVHCPDPATHRHRVEHRKADMPGMQLPNWNDVASRAFEPFPEALEIDSERLTIAQSVEKILQALDFEEKKYV